MSNLSKTDWIDRTQKGSSPGPRLVFSLLRLIDPCIQYGIMYQGYGLRMLSKLGIATVGAGEKGKILMAMTTATALKHSFHAAFIQEEKATYSVAITIGIFETLSNAFATISALVYNPTADLGILQYVGIALFGVGYIVELTAELQRKRFKDNPANKGKLYTGGFFSLARHINYGSYTLYRTGFALTSGNYWLAALQFVLHTCDFALRAVPCLNEYCGKKYGDDWKKFQRDVPYTLFPYIW